MAQHDFAPAWLNFPAPAQSAKPSQTYDKSAEPSHFDSNSDVIRRRHNSSDGFESVSGRNAGNYAWREKNGWRGRNGSEEGGSRGAVGSQVRAREGAQGGKSKVPEDGGRSRKDNGHGDKQFQAEDFPSLNPDAEKEVNLNKSVGVGVWEHPPNPKTRMSKMMVIKRMTKDEQTPAPQCSVSTQQAPAVYKGSVPKSASLPLKGSRSSSLSPVDKVSQPRLMMRLTRMRSDKKSQFLKALKQDMVDEESLDDHCKDEQAFSLQNSNLGHRDENRNRYERSASQENGNATLATRQQVLRSSTFPQQEVLSSSLEAEHRLLKEMGWQEESENDETCAPLTEDELKEFQAISEQLQRNGLRKNGFLKNGLVSDILTTWRSSSSSSIKTAEETEETETSSSDTSDDEA
ncbi:vasculin [Chanos chanos]|uniref:Vasculin n=1 Tax=Chanos chanos TaxID=29144 RepID=A0A6J2UXT6_CHACN|nr:vasculin [Chanos chanos]